MGVVTEVVGFSSDKKRNVNIACYKLTKDSVGSPRVEIRSTEDYSFEKIVKDFGVEISLDANLEIGIGKYISLFSGLSLPLYKIEFIDSASSTALSKSYLYAAVYSYPKTIYTATDSNILTDVGQTYYNQWLARNNTNDPYFRNLCGDKVPTSYERYAATYLNYKFKFSDLLSLKQFTNTIGTSVGIIDFTSQLSQTTSKYNFRGQVSVQAIQIGGDAASFASAVASSSDCSFGNMGLCNSAVQKWSTYTSTFLQQVQTLDNGEIKGSVTYEDVSSFGLNVGNSIITPQISQARDELDLLYSNNRKYAIVSDLDNIFKSDTKFATSLSRKSEVLRGKIEYNLALILDSDIGANVCYSNPANCEEIVRNLKTKLKPIAVSDAYLYDSKFKYHYNGVLDCGILIPNGEGKWFVESSECTGSYGINKISATAGVKDNEIRCPVHPAAKLELTSFNAEVFDKVCIKGQLTFTVDETRTNSYAYSCTSSDGGSKYICSPDKFKVFEEAGSYHGGMATKTNAGTCYNCIETASYLERQNNPYYFKQFSSNDIDLADNTFDCKKLSDVCGPEDKTDGGNAVRLGIGLGIGGLVLLIFTIGVARIYCRRSPERVQRPDQGIHPGFDVPIGIALSQDKIELIALNASRVSFDYADNGIKARTTWVGSKDAFLVYDHNDNHKVDFAKELVLTRWSSTATTDFMALKEVFDSNKDNKFDANDAEFNRFLIWQDKNQDGVSQIVELTPLQKAGLVQIDFDTERTIDGEFFGRQQGMQVAEVHWADGHRTLAYDLALEYAVA